MKKNKVIDEGLYSVDDSVDMKQKVELAEKVNVLSAELEALRKNKFETDNNYARLLMEQSFKETKKELETNNLIVKFIKMKMVPRAELLKAGATIDDWSGIATLSGVRFKATFLNKNFYRVIQGAS